ncbi:MAG: FecR domain-containing protein [Acidobacteriaceae bacterium]
MPRATILTLFLTAASAVAVAQIVTQPANTARPETTNDVGAINYVEGRAFINGHPLVDGSSGNSTLVPGQRLTTGNGKVEILLTPGVFLRVGENSTVRLVSPDLTHTEVALDRGHADVEVDQIYKENTLLVDLSDGQTQMLNHGLYAFNADPQQVEVFDGQASVYPGSDYNTDVQPIEVKGSHELAINGEPAKPQHFNKRSAQDQLYQWSSLRSQYLGEANVQLAESYAGEDGFDPGWYWAGDPYGYTWLPGDGLFWNPFGLGFYSPAYLYGGGFLYGGYYGRGFYPYRGGFYGRSTLGGEYRGGTAIRTGGFRGGGPGGGFHGGGGGFHGGGGGFHGGGGGHR